MSNNRIRNPGEGFELSDEELLAVPPRLLTKAQRKRRRVLKNRVDTKIRQSRQFERKAAGRNKVRGCQGTNKRGEPCGAYALEGAKHCLVHLNEAEKAKLGRKTLQEMGADARRLDRPEKLNVMAQERAIAEIAHAKILQRRYSPLGLEFRGYDEEGHPILIDKGAEAGLCLHGESKDGDIVMTSHPDLAGQFTITEKILDRVYGRPRQTQVIEGGQRPVQVQPVRNMERARQVAGLLHRVGAVPHEGRKRPAPPLESETSQTTGEVVPLRDGKGD